MATRSQVPTWIACDLLDAGLDELSDERAGSGLSSREADGSLAGVVAFEVVLERRHRVTGHRVEAQ